MTTTFRTHMHGRSAAANRELYARIAAANDEARANFDDAGWRAERAAEMTEVIYEGFAHENLLDLMATVETVAEGDRITIKEVRGLRVFWISGGGTIDQSVLDSEEMELREDRVGYHVSEHEDKIRANFTENQANIVDLAIQQMDAEINLRLLRLWQAAIPLGNPSYSQGNGLSLATLNAMLLGVEDETLEDIPVIIGRAAMVNQIMDAIQGSGFFTPETNEEILRLGVLGKYRGANVIKLRNFKDPSGVSFFPRNELYVAGRDAAKFGFWGGLNSKEWMELGGFYWHNMGWRKAGGAVTHSLRARRYVDTSLTAG